MTELNDSNADPSRNDLEESKNPVFPEINRQLETLNDQVPLNQSATSSNPFLNECVDTKCDPLLNVNPIPANTILNNLQTATQVENTIIKVTSVFTEALKIITGQRQQPKPTLPQIPFSRV